MKTVEHTLSRLLAHERIRAARRHVERADELTLARQAALSATPAPTGAEAARGARVAELFREIGLSHVGVDQAGNVRGWFGNGDGSAPVVLAAHLDTVFGPEVDVRVTRHGQRLEGPGISDNARKFWSIVNAREVIGYAPQDDSEIKFAAGIAAILAPLHGPVPARPFPPKVDDPDDPSRPGRG